MNVRYFLSVYMLHYYYSLDNLTISIVQASFHIVKNACNMERVPTTTCAIAHCYANLLISFQRVELIRCVVIRRVHSRSFICLQSVLGNISLQIKFLNFTFWNIVPCCFLGGWFHHNIIVRLEILNKVKDHGRWLRPSRFNSAVEESHHASLCDTATKTYVFESDLIDITSILLSVYDSLNIIEPTISSRFSSICFRISRNMFLSYFFV